MREGTFEGLRSEFLSQGGGENKPKKKVVRMPVVESLGKKNKDKVGKTVEVDTSTPFGEMIEEKKSKGPVTPSGVDHTRSPMKE